MPTPIRREYLQRRRPQQPFTRTQRLDFNQETLESDKKSDHTYRPVVDYDYYDDGDVKVVGNSKVSRIH